MTAIAENEVVEAAPPVLLSNKSFGSPTCGKDQGDQAKQSAEKASEVHQQGKSPRSLGARLLANLVSFLTGPCQLWRFVSGLYDKFGGFVPVGALQYGINQGLGMSIGGLAQRYYLKDVLDLHSQPALMQNLRTAAKIPWNIKPVMGMLSDAYPLLGYHRTSYMGLAAGCGVVAYVSLGTVPLVAIATVPFLALINISVATPDVMIDATAAKLSKDSPESASDLQSLVWGALPMGLLLGGPFSGVLVKAMGPKLLLLVTGLCPLTIFVAAVLRWLPEERLPKGQRKLDLTFLKQHGPVTILAACMSVLSITLSVLQVVVESATVRGIIVVVCGVILAVSVYFSLRKISTILAKTALFIFVRECMQPNLGDAMFIWMTDAEDGPRFPPQLMGALECVGAVGLFLGVVLYNKYLTTVSYRRIFLLAQVSLVLYNMSDLILVKRWNLAVGIPDWVFVMGDDAFGALCGRFFMMPLFVLCSKVCPDNLEATLFAMLMALSNFGSTVGDFFGSTLCDVFSIKDDNYDMMPEAVIAKSFCRLLPMPLIFLLVPNLTPQDPIPGTGDGGDGDENPELQEKGMSQQVLEKTTTEEGVVLASDTSSRDVVGQVLGDSAGVSEDRCKDASADAREISM